MSLKRYALARATPLPTFGWLLPALQSSILATTRKHRAQLPCAGAGARVAALRKRRKRFTGHLSVRRKSHLEFSAGRRSGREGLAREEGCLNLARRHVVCSKDGACCDERHCKSKPTKAQHGEVPLCEPVEDTMPTPSGKTRLARQKWPLDAYVWQTAWLRPTSEGCRRTFIAHDFQPLTIRTVLPRCYPGVARYARWMRERVREALRDCAVSLGRHTVGAEMTTLVDATRPRHGK